MQLPQEHILYSKGIPLLGSNEIIKQRRIERASDLHDPGIPLLMRFINDAMSLAFDPYPIAIAFLSSPALKYTLRLGSVNIDHQGMGGILALGAVPEGAWLCQGSAMALD